MALPFGLTKVDGQFKGEGKCSTFGDAEDVKRGLDNGIGSTGFRTVDHPTSPYTALPIPIWTALDLKGFERVIIESGGKKVRGFLADKGPAASLGRIVDCSPEILRLLGVNTDANVSVCIIPSEIVPAAERNQPARLA